VSIAGVTTTDCAIAIFINGISGTELSRGDQNSLTTGTAGLTVNDFFQCTAGDVINVGVYGSASKALNVGLASQNYFSGFLVSTT